MSLPAWILAVVLVLAFGRYYGWAALAALVGAVVYIVDGALFDEKPCSCEGGKVWSPFTRKFKRHRACGSTGFRKHLGHRLFNRNK